MHYCLQHWYKQVWDQKNGCGLKWKCVLFNKNIIKVENAYKDITIYDDDMNIIGHKFQDGDLKTEESYRNIPMSARLKKCY